MFEGVITALVTPFRRDLLDEDALAPSRRRADRRGRRRAGAGRHDGRIADADQRRAHPRHRGGDRGGGEARPGHRRHRLELDARGDRACRSRPSASGADGLLLVTPYYNRPGQEHLYRHFRSIMQAAPLPTVVYNVPDADRVRSAARDHRAPRRDARAGRRRRRRPARRCARRRSSRASADRVAVLSGDDATAFPLFALGGARRHLRGQQRRARADERDVGRGGGGRLEQGARSSTTGCCRSARGCSSRRTRSRSKAALAMMGRMTEEIRPPLYPLAPSRTAPSCARSSTSSACSTE